MFLSSLEDVQDKARGFELGANDYLTKPFEILEVKARVRSLLKAKAYADAIRAAQERDLAIAREIQMGLLPSDFASLGRGMGLDVHATIEPARHVGGDLFEVLRVSEDRLVVAVGDVCGKGITAALFMAVTVTLLAHAGPPARGAERDPRAAERGAGRPEPARDVRDHGLPRGARRAGHLRQRGPRRRAAGGLVGAAAAGLPLVRNRARSLPRPGLRERDPGARSRGHPGPLHGRGERGHDAASALFGEERLQACFAGGAGQTAAETVERLLQRGARVRGGSAAVRRHHHPRPAAHGRAVADPAQGARP